MGSCSCCASAAAVAAAAAEDLQPWACSGDQSEKRSSPRTLWIGGGVPTTTAAADDGCCLGGGSLGLGLLTLPEAVLEAAGQVLEVPHAASACGLAANGLLTPLECPLPGSRVAAARACALLDVV